MKVDLLRQLDEWGSAFEAAIAHVAPDEVLERRPEVSAPELKPTDAVKPRWRRPVRVAGGFAIAIALLAVALPAFYRLAVGDEVATNFRSVGGSPGLTSLRVESQSDAQGSSPLSIQQAPTTAAPTTTVAAATTTTAPVEDPLPPVNNAASLGRSIIFTADMTIATPDVAAAVDTARAIVESRGGFIASQESTERTTVMSLKVQPEFFQDTIDRLGELGTVRQERVASQDVTELIVDLESQIRTSETSVTRLQGFLAEADNIETVARLERELLDRETALERLRGQLRTLEDQVALSTIVVTFRRFAVAPAVDLAITRHATLDVTGEQCFTTDGPAPIVDEPFVICLDLTNTGNLDLTDLTISGPAEIVDRLVPIGGTRLTNLPAGERYVLWAELLLAESLREEIVIQAVPVTEDGERLIEQTLESVQPLVVSLRQPQLDMDDDGGLPSLGEALGAGWSVVRTIVNGVAVGVAFVLPLLWIPAVGLLVLWWRRRHGS